VPGAAFPGFSQPRNLPDLCRLRSTPAQHRQNPRPACLLREIVFPVCTKSGHPPVDALHLIENKSDKDARFLLTLKLESVKR
jgi:hypothetical protein